MASRAVELIRAFLTETYGSRLSFNNLLEAVLVEYINVNDWESSNRWNADESGKTSGPREFKLESSDFANITTPGASISRSGYVFLPTDFALSRAEGSKVLKHIAGRLRDNGHVILSCRPGFGVDSEDIHSAFPAVMYKNLTNDEKSIVQDQLGQGQIIFSVDGEPISELLHVPTPPDVDDGRKSALEVFLGGRGQAQPTSFEELPAWLKELAVAIDEATKAGSITQSVAKARGFEYNLVLSSKDGDSVLVISKEMARAAYLFKKQMHYQSTSSPQPAPSDWDVVVNAKMKDFYSKYHRRPRGTKKENIPAPNLADATQPKLALRGWMLETEQKWHVEQGFALRRDFNKNHIISLMKNGINYKDAAALADKTLPTGI